MDLKYRHAKLLLTLQGARQTHKRGTAENCVNFYKKELLTCHFLFRKKSCTCQKRTYYCSISRTITFTLLMHSSSFALPFQLFLHCLRLPLKMRRDSHLVVILELPSFNACLSIRFFEKAVPLKGIGIWT